MSRIFGSIREPLLVVIGFTTAALLLTLPVAAQPTRTLPSDLIDTLLNTWVIGWDADRLRHGLDGVWDAPIFYPYRNTLAFSENLFGLAFLVAPVYWLSGNPVLTYNVAFIFSFALSGLGMYLLVRELTKSSTCALIAGMYYAFCPFRMSHISHIQMVATGWIPVTLYGLHRFFATHARRWLVVFVAGYSLQALSNTYVLYFLTVPVALVIIDGLGQESVYRRRAMLELAAAGLVIAAVLAPVAFQYRQVRSDYRQVRSAGEISRGGADVRSYLVGKNSIGVWRWLPTAVDTDPEKELFPGFVAVVLAAIALGRSRKGNDPYRRWVRLYALVAGAGAVLSLGPHIRIAGYLLTRHGPYDWMLYLVPGMDGIRVPARFAIVFVTGLSVVAGCGAGLWVTRLRRPWRHVAFAGCVAAVIAEGWAVPLPTHRYSPRGRPEDRAVAEWLSANPPGAVLHLPIKTYNFEELNYQYATLFHGRPLVNGLSGYSTPLQRLLRDSRSPLYDWERFPAVVQMLRSLGVRYAIVHMDDYNHTQRENGEIRYTIAGFRESAQIVRETGLLTTRAFELEAWPDAPLPAERVEPVARHEFTPSASGTLDRIANLVDDDRESRWFADQDGSSWVAAEFPRGYDVARVELQLAERTVLDYPRELEVHGTDSSGQSRVLYRASPYPEFMAAFLRDSRYPNLVISLPHNQTTKLWIRGTGRVPGWRWSVHELRLWRRF